MGLAVWDLGGVTYGVPGAIEKNQFLCRMCSKKLKSILQSVGNGAKFSWTLDGGGTQEALPSFGPEWKHLQDLLRLVAFLCPCRFDSGTFP